MKDSNLFRPAPPHTVHVDWTAIIEDQRRTIVFQEEELERLRETNRRLNRRCTDMEGALKEKLEKGKAEYRNFGRVLANAAAGMYKAQLEKAEADKAKLITFVRDVEISADRSYLRIEAWKLLEELQK